MINVSDLKKDFPIFEREINGKRLTIILLIEISLAYWEITWDITIKITPKAKIKYLNKDLFLSLLEVKTKHAPIIATMNI